MILKRATCYINGFGGETCYGDSWWYSKTGYIVKYSLVGGIFLFFLLWFVGGYLHAKRRLKKGLQPLAYHRWLVSRRYRYPNPQNHFTFYQSRQYNYPGPQQNGYYGMQNYQEPLPLYTNDAPPGYQPPPKMYPGQPVPQPAQGAPIPPPGPQETGIVGNAPNMPAQPLRAKLAGSNPLRWLKK